MFVPVVSGQKLPIYQYYIHKLWWFEQDGPHRFMHLRTWCSVGGNIWEGLGFMTIHDFIGGLGRALSFQKLASFSALPLTLCLLLVDEYISSQLLLQHHACLDDLSIIDSP